MGAGERECSVGVVDDPGRGGIECWTAGCETPDTREGTAGRDVLSMDTAVGNGAGVGVGAGAEGCNNLGNNLGAGCCWLRRP